MWFSSWSAKWQRVAPSSRRHASRRRRLASPPPLAALESLEDRVLLSAYSAATAAALVADINAANKAGGASTITLTAPIASPYVLSNVDNNTNGANGLPVIGTSNAVNLTIIGNADTIERDAAAGTPAFRLFDVAGGSSLTLESVTLQNGVAQGSGAAADGGAIYNPGNLTLIGATLQGNAALGANGANGPVLQVVPQGFQPSSLNGQPGGNAAGGAIWSSGSVTLEGGTVLEQNQARGGQGGASGSTYAIGLGNGGAGGSATGGALDEAGGSVTIGNTTLADNAVIGGNGGNLVQGVNIIAIVRKSGGAGGIGAGGGLYAAQGTLNMSSTLVQSNSAWGGNGGNRFFDPHNVTRPGFGGNAYGGGIDVSGGTASVTTTDLASNLLVGGQGGSVGFSIGGNAFGGGLYVGGGASTLTNDTVAGNEALEGMPGSDGNGIALGGVGPTAGGGIDIAAAATVSLDSSTLNNTANNYIDFVDPDITPEEISNINGTYTLLP